MKLEFRNIYKAFGKRQVLQDIELCFDEPGICAVLGPNGSGKTTLMKCLLGMVLPNSGDILLNERSVLKQWKYRDELGYLPQIARFPDNLTVRELLAMLDRLRPGQKRQAELIEKFEINSYLQYRLGHLSGGTRQKVNLVLALRHDSPLLLLDEPTSGLDPVALIQLKEILRQERERGKLIMITTHSMDFVEVMADEIVFLLDGKVYFRGSLPTLKASFGATDVEHAIANILREKHLSTPIPVES